MRWALVVLVAAGCAAELHPGAVDHSLPRGTPNGLDHDVLDQILSRAANEHSSAVVVVKDGKIAVEAYRDGYHGEPIMAMSASKSIVSMAIGRLIGEHKLALDTRLAEVFPEWTSATGAITIRKLLSHTSGIDPTRASWKIETIVEHAAKAKLVFEPGTNFQYNNDGVDLLAAVVTRVAHVRLDEYLEKTIFRPLDIVGARWVTDSEGTPRGAGELIIRPVDLAKLGQLMLDGGTWHGEQILPADWVASSVAISQPFNDDYGFLWWRDGEFGRVLSDQVLAQWLSAGVAPGIVEHARAVVGKRYPNERAYRRALQTAVGSLDFGTLMATVARGDHIPLANRVGNGPVHGFSAEGWLGQYLVVLPHTHVVAVRMRASERTDYQERGHDHDSDATFISDVGRLAR